MSDNPFILPFPSGKHTSPVSSLFASPRLSEGLSAKGYSDSEAAMSPTSILETKSLSVIGNPFFSERSHRKPYRDNRNSRAIGLGIVHSLTKEEESEKNLFSPTSRKVLFGSQLKVHIPSLQSTSISPTGSVESPHTPIEFGIKNKNSQLALHSPAGFGCEVRSPLPRLFSGCLPPGEMELSEDYTCVISNGPNPKKTHIFDNCILDNCGDGFVAPRNSNAFSADFLSFCHACKKSLAQGKDIFMYRGERAFCSRECGKLEMLSDDGRAENCFHDILLDPL